MPLGRKVYDRIPHLPGSRTGKSDRRCPPELARRCLVQAKPGEEVLIQEKLDGSCVAIARINGELVALGRQGRRADQSPTGGRRRFARWVAERTFELDEGDVIVGEWLALAHGTRYRLAHEPFVAFDLFVGGERVKYDELVRRVKLPTPALLHRGGALPVKAALELLGEHGRHGALDPAEGLVYRVEALSPTGQRNRARAHVSLAKFVRPGKVDGSYLPENSGKPPVWNAR
jgi:hypothetical protein